MDDIRAVMDDAGSERAVLFGWEDGGCQSLLYAASYPERTLALILFGIWVKYSESPDYPWGWTPERTARFWESLLANKWGTEEYWRTDSSLVSLGNRVGPRASSGMGALFAPLGEPSIGGCARTPKLRNRCSRDTAVDPGPDIGHAPAG